MSGCWSSYWKLYFSFFKLINKFLKNYFSNLNYWYEKFISSFSRDTWTMKLCWLISWIYCVNNWIWAKNEMWVYLEDRRFRDWSENCCIQRKVLHFRKIRKLVLPLDMIYLRICSCSCNLVLYCWDSINFATLFFIISNLTALIGDFMDTVDFWGTINFLKAYLLGTI